MGFSRAGEVEDAAWLEYERWLASGRHAGMEYMERYRDVRRDPRLLLEGASWVISIAFGYTTATGRQKDCARISRYALVKDYHNWIKKELRRSGIGALLGEEHQDWRICVDSAPVMERYWAVKSGLAVRGRNGSAIVPGTGCEVFLAEIVTNADLHHRKPSQPEEGTPFQGEAEDKYMQGAECLDCGKCIRACPTGALRSDGTIDCDRCISYLTIEHRGEWLDRRQVAAMRTEAGRHTLFGCDRCIEACPLNITAQPCTADRYISQSTVGLTPDDIIKTDDDTLRSMLQGSSLKRAGIEGLRRNAANNKD